LFSNGYVNANSYVVQNHMQSYAKKEFLKNTILRD